MLELWEDGGREVCAPCYLVKGRTVFQRKGGRLQAYVQHWPRIKRAKTFNSKCSLCFGPITGKQAASQQRRHALNERGKGKNGLPAYDRLITDYFPYG